MRIYVRILRIRWLKYLDSFNKRTNPNGFIRFEPIMPAISALEI